MLLRLVVEEISEIECRTLQQETEPYNVTSAEEGKTGRRKEGKPERERTEETKRERKGTEGKGRSEWRTMEAKALLTRAISGIESNIFLSS
jgi:hypothetical protein